MRLKKTVKIESTQVPDYVTRKRLDKYQAEDDVKERLLDFQYWEKFRKPNIAARLQNFVFGGILIDKYNGLRRDEFLLRQYNIKSIAFGSWVKNEDRINFLAALAVAMYDLQTILKTTNLGRKVLQIDWGGIGVKGAAGVFFREHSLITMPRYKRPDKYLARLEDMGFNTSAYRNKFFEPINTPRGTIYTLNKAGKVWIMGTAGWGSFAHEYGHFIDAYIASKALKSDYVTGKYCLPVFDTKDFLKTDPNTNLRYGTLKEKDICRILTGQNIFYKDLLKPEQAFFDWLTAMYFTKSVSKQYGTLYKPNAQYKRLLKYRERYGANWTYWGSIIELWARTFEIYVAEFLSRKGVTNTFLVRADKKFGRDVRYLEGGKVEVIDDDSSYPTRAHVWQNKRVFEKIIDIFVKL